jgi:hypothetical protein
MKRAILIVVIVALIGGTAACVATPTDPSSLPAAAVSR